MRQLTVTAARARGSAGLAGRSRCLAVVQPPPGGVHHGRQQWGDLTRGRTS